MEAPGPARKSAFVVLLVRANLGSAGNLTEPPWEIFTLFSCIKSSTQLKNLRNDIWSFLLAYLGSALCSFPVQFSVGWHSPGTCPPQGLGGDRARHSAGSRTHLPLSPTRCPLECLLMFACHPGRSRSSKKVRQLIQRCPCERNGHDMKLARWHLCPHPSLFQKYRQSFLSQRRCEFLPRGVEVQIPSSNRKCTRGIKSKLRPPRPAQGPARRSPSPAATRGPLCSRTNLHISASPRFLKPFLHTPHPPDLLRPCPTDRERSHSPSFFPMPTVRESDLLCVSLGAAPMSHLG